MAQTLADVTSVSAAKNPTLTIFNATFKTNCNVVPCPSQVFPRIEHWTQHWGLTVALDGIAAYQNWISARLVPIVFAWIEENKKAVYAKVDSALIDDFETVIHAAFEVMKQKTGYKETPENSERFNEDVASGAVRLASINPTWAKIADNLCGQIKDKSKSGM